MPWRGTPYPQEFREQILELVKLGRTPGELAREYGLTAQTIRNWRAQERARESGRGNGALPGSEKEELQRLRREVKILRQEKEILKKAAAWFARESVMPGESSSS